jgi:hypothetical protein
MIIKMTNYYKEVQAYLLPDLLNIIKEYVKPTLLEVKEYYDYEINNVDFTLLSLDNIEIGDIININHGEFFYIDRVNIKSCSGYKIQAVNNSKIFIYDDMLHLIELNFKNLNRIGYTTGQKRNDRHNFKFRNCFYGVICKIFIKHIYENKKLYYTSLTKTGFIYSNFNKLKVKIDDDVKDLPLILYSKPFNQKYKLYKNIYEYLKCKIRINLINITEIKKTELLYDMLKYNKNYLNKINENTYFIKRFIKKHNLFYRI